MMAQLYFKCFRRLNSPAGFEFLAAKTDFQLRGARVGADRSCVIESVAPQARLGNKRGGIGIGIGGGGVGVGGRRDGHCGA